MSTIIYHKHHIIPKHAGGTDDPSNIIKVNIALHSFLHKLLYEQYGKESDRLAWLGLSGIINKKDILKKLSESIEQRKIRSKRMKGVGNHFFGKKHTNETRKKISANRKGKCSGSENGMFNKTHTKQAKENISNKNSKRVLKDGKIFKSALEASQNLNMGNHSTISKYCRKRIKGFQYF